jgi:hypothetical protein
MKFIEEDGKHMIHTLSSQRHERYHRGLLLNSYSHSTGALLCGRKDDACWAEKNITIMANVIYGTTRVFFHIRP